MAIPHRCPICEGRGEIGKRLAQVGSVLVSEKPQRFRCHGCNGTGILWDHSFTIDFQPNTIQTPPPWINPTPQWPDGTIISRNPGDCPGIVNKTLLDAVGRNPVVGDGVQHTNGFLHLQPVEMTFTPVGDGVVKCSDCKEPIYMAPAKGCQRASSHSRPVAGKL